MSALPITGDEDADRLLEEDPLALLLGALLDQQVPMERAYAAPHRLRERLGGELDARRIARMPEEELEEVFRRKPALHRFPASMAARTRKLCGELVERYDGDAAALWRTAETGQDLLGRLKKLPGFGDSKSQMFLAILGKRFDAAPEGWREAAGSYADDQPRSAADVAAPEDLEAVRAFKKQA